MLIPVQSPWHYFGENIPLNRSEVKIFADRLFSTSQTACHLCDSDSTIFDGVTGECLGTNYKWGHEYVCDLKLRMERCLFG
jgi:hypothetical protein